ncbi:MAG TPA: RES family NAD+ phosphorylase [Allosphingosinicella sp.]
MAEAAGHAPAQACSRCGSATGCQLGREELEWLAHAFFVRGSIHRVDYGGAPTIQFNELQSGSLEPDTVLEKDIGLLQQELGIGFFRYGPRLWMIGEIEPLKRLRHARRRARAIAEILQAYPVVEMGAGAQFYRLRKAPAVPASTMEYDAPPSDVAGSGRLDSPGSPVLYASQDLQVCIHECRVTAEDELYVATLKVARPLRLLDLTAILDEEEELTEFESLDLAVHMLFLAGPHAYPVTRDLAATARQRGFDGLIYPSYFSLLRTGAVPFETAYGMSLRRFENMRDHERSKIVPNCGIFGRPVRDGRVEVSCINRLVLNRVHYEVGFGPITY